MKYAVLMMVLLSGCSVRSGTIEPVAPPDFTVSSLIVPHGALQAESGYTMNWDGTAAEHSVGEFTLRGGLAEGVEWRVGLGSLIAAAQGPVQWAAPELGGSVELVRSRGALPQVAVAAGTVIPLSVGDRWEPSASLGAAWYMANASEVHVAAGVSRAVDGPTTQAAFAGDITGVFPINDRLAAWAALAGSNTPGLKFQSESSAGLTFLITPLLQLDARVGAGLGESRGQVHAGLAFARRW